VSAYQSDNKNVQRKSALAREKAATDWFPKLIAALGALLLISGALIALFHPAMLVSPHDEISGAVHIYAGYLASRNLALAVMLLAALALGAKRLLNNLLLLLSLIQLFDAAIDVVEGRWSVASGVLVLAILFFAASGSLSGYPFWKTHAWKETDSLNAPAREESR
jgi:hypothetical protein